MMNLFQILLRYQLFSFSINKTACKSCFSGDGGDELFCGYNRYIFSKKFSNFRFVPTILRKALSSLILSISPKKLNIILNFMPILNHYVGFGDRMHKGANALKVKDLSHDILFFNFTLAKSI